MRRLLVAAALGVAVSCAASGGLPRATVRLAGDAGTLTLRVEVAATTAARTRGLMHRESLSDRAGMLFLFPARERLVFWMKDTLIPLDIAFIRDGRVLEVRGMEPCRAEPCPSTISTDPADAALEVGRGVLEAAGIGPGARVSIAGRLPTPR